MTETYRIRSVDTWIRARDDYLAGLDAEAVCRRYDVGLSAFRRRARKYGWRRIDQDDPSPGDPGLSIYADIDADDQVETARLRFVQALSHGKATEAMRWRRLWLELRDQIDAIDAELFPGQSRAQINALLAADAADDDETEEEALLLAMPPREHPSSGPASVEKVHDVHSIFSAGNRATGFTPPSAGP
jgi:hypothetical protein